MLVSKVLQNLANGLEFGSKESHMITLNPFIVETLPAVYAFFDRLTVTITASLLTPVDSHRQKKKRLTFVIYHHRMKMR